MNYRILQKENFFEPNALFHYSEVNESENRGFHTHTFFEIILTLSDNYRHYINETKLILLPHSLIFVRADDIHMNLFPDIAQHHIQFLIDKNEMFSFFKYLNDTKLTETLLNAPISPTVNLNSYDYRKVMKLFDRINLLNADNRDEVNLYCKKVLICLFTDYFSNYSTALDKEIPAWLNDALEITNSQKLFIEGINKLVETSGKSYEHLSRCMKEYLNLTPSEYINDLRINYAANLCRNTNQPITDICYSCGFNNISYFYSLFNKKYGCTPLELRNRYSIFD
ncbi:MAG: AraC family transcriptional regulator [Eubacteriales bacterium]|nr:AraC family transcriptional regulator [Eubacteriales bacterium]MDY4213745.1 AraC family transcriptional regulator [Eubacteriales bacterium]